MKKLYRVRLQDNFKSILPLESSKIEEADGINFKSLSQNWHGIDFYFENVDGVSTQEPDISFTTVATAAIAFPAQLKNVIFPNPTNGLEFLPIDVSGESWILVNCLNSTNQYDSIESKFLRDPTISDEGCNEEALLQKLTEMLKNDSTDVDFLREGNGQI